MVHSVCGGFGGAHGKAARHEQELAHAAANLFKAFPGIQVPGYFVDFGGL